MYRPQGGEDSWSTGCSTCNAEYCNTAFWIAHHDLALEVLDTGIRCNLAGSCKHGLRAPHLSGGLRPCFHA
jgi:hypothetical protein